MSKFPNTIKVTEEFIDINGINQYLLHMEGNKENPVLLFLHGGPGSAESLFAHLCQPNWEKNFNVVHWDQRGAGKTLSKNKKLPTPPSLDDMILDLFHLVKYLKEKYNKDKIILLGHSWGSVLGTTFIKKHPEDISSYIGVGQVINMMENERIGYEKVREEIIKANNTADLKKIDSIGVYPPKEITKKTLKTLGQVRSLQGKYKLAITPSAKLMLEIIKGPIFKFSDLISLSKGLFVNFELLKYLFEDYDLYKESFEYKVPVYYILGDKDWQTPYPIATEYFEKINAPKKELFMIKDAGHMTMLDNPEDFYNALIKCSK